MTRARRSGRLHQPTVYRRRGAELRRRRALLAIYVALAAVLLLVAVAAVAS